MGYRQRSIYLIYQRLDPWSQVSIFQTQKGSCNKQCLIVTTIISPCCDVSRLTSSVWGYESMIPGRTANRMPLSIMGSADCTQLNQTRDAIAGCDSGCNASLCGLYTVTTALTAKYIPSTSSRLR